MARTRSENFEDIREAILAKAAELFAARGYERSSISDLAEVCGLSRGALYHYFDSKEALLYSMLHTHVAGMLDLLREADAKGGTPLERLTRFIEAIVSINAASQCEQAILLNDLGSLREDEQAEIKGLEQQIVELVSQTLVETDRSGRITRANRKVYTMILLGMINFTYTWYDPDAAVKPQAFARMATDVFLNGFLTGTMTAQQTTPRQNRRAKVVARRKA